ncbi:3-oxoacyl-[acyl-carrier-protein] synthase 2 OS=Streptomyces microflavus OX=1919 GN=Smic_01780 PE=3 SV=1 [Streptomyces microflavus]
MNRPAIAVTGLGIYYPAGHTTDTTWDGICRGESFARTVPELHGCAVDFACTVTGIDLDGAVGGRTAFRMGRYVEFAVLAALEAVTDAGLDPAHWDGARVAVVVGTSSGGIRLDSPNRPSPWTRGPEATSPSGILLTIPSMPAAEIAIQMKATGPSLAPCTACSSGVTALRGCADAALGQCDIAIAGVTESIVFPVAMTGFARSGAAALRDGDPARLCRPFAADRAGLVTWLKAPRSWSWSGSTTPAPG